MDAAAARGEVPANAEAMPEQALRSDRQLLLGAKRSVYITQRRAFNDEMQTFRSTASPL